MALRAKGMTYNEIIRAVFGERHVMISKSNVSDWVNGRHHPYGSAYEFTPTPSPELSYVIGVSKGDGSVRVQKWNHRVRLRVIDREFAQEFDRCASSVLGSPRHAITWLPKQGLWCVEVLSALLVRFLQGPLSKLVPIVSHCEMCAAGFLRGFFDSEASMSGRSLNMSNGDVRLVRLAKRLLLTLGILTTGPRLARLGGRLVTIKGKVYHANKDIYGLRVRAQSLAKYAEKVGFSIQRKRSALSMALSANV